MPERRRPRATAATARRATAATARCRIAGVLAAAVLIGTAGVARAQTRDPGASMPVPAEVAEAAGTAAQRRGPVTRTLVLLGGATAGLAVHEAGHVFTSLAFGARPSVAALESGPVPFFAVRHAPVSRRKEFVISSAGLWMQHAGSEWILTARPDLRHESAPFLKGLFAFNLATSAVYSATAFTRSGAAERDTLGMATSLGRDGVPEPVVGVLILGPAVLDGYRYLHPDARWAVWASRAFKIAGVAATAFAGRE